MDKKLNELLNRIGSDKELVSNFSLSLKTGKHLNITGLCAEQKVYVGQYDAKSGEWVPSGEYEVIDYVHSYYDDRAVFSSSMGCYIDQFLPYDEVDRLFPGHDGTPSGKAYYFMDSEGDTFVAVRLEDFGGSRKKILEKMTEESLRLIADAKADAAPGSAAEGTPSASGDGKEDKK